jgi:hypothetical protein
MTTNNGVHEGKWQAVGSKNSGNDGDVPVGTIAGENGGSPMQVAAERRENVDNPGRSNATNINNTSEDDGIQSDNMKTGYMEVHFMKVNSKGFNVARALKQFLAVAREQDGEFMSLPLAGIGNYLCIEADVPNSKAGTEQYFRHDVKFNNINGKLRIRTLQGLDQLKWGRSKFCVYLEQQRVYINKDQLGGWTLKLHPAFCYRDDMKEALYNIMGDEFKGVQYALFPKTIKYKRSKYGAKTEQR